MQYTVLTGKICTVPTLHILSIDEQRSMCICEFVVATLRDSYSFDSGSKDNYDFFQCAVYDDAAEQVSERFSKGVQVTIIGKICNHMWKDDNQTSHFSDVLLAFQIEFGDFVMLNSLRDASDMKILQKPVVSDIKHIEEMYEEALRNGFICLDENDYFNIAMSNMQIPDM